MKRITTMLAIGATALFFTACGGGSSSASNETSPKTAANILIGNTFYYTNSYLDFPDGYYTDTFESDKVIENEHMADGTIIYTTIFPTSYSGLNVTFNVEGNIVRASVSQEDNHILLSSASGGSMGILWYTLEDAKKNPRE